MISQGLLLSGYMKACVLLQAQIHCIFHIKKLMPLLTVVSSFNSRQKLHQVHYYSFLDFLILMTEIFKTTSFSLLHRAQTYDTSFITT